MEAIEELSELSESMRQAASLLADDDPSDDAAPRRPTTFLNAVALGNVVSIGPPQRPRPRPLRRKPSRDLLLLLVCSDLIRFPIRLCVQGAGKSAVLNSLIGHPVLVSS